MPERRHSGGGGTGSQLGIAGCGGAVGRSAGVGMPGVGGGTSSVGPSSALEERDQVSAGKTASQTTQKNLNILILKVC